MVTCHYFVYYYHTNRIPVNKVQGYVLVRPLLVSGVAWIGEHLNVVARLHHVMPHKCVDDRSLYHVWKRESRQGSYFSPACVLHICISADGDGLGNKGCCESDKLQINHFKKITIFLIHMMKYTVQ